MDGVSAYSSGGEMAVSFGEAWKKQQQKHQVN